MRTDERAGDGHGAAHGPDGGTAAALSELASGAGGAWLVSLAGIALAFVTMLALSRLLPAEQFGAFFYTLTWAEVLSMVAPLGFDKLLIRELALERAAGRWSLARGLLRCAASRTALGVAAALAVAAGFALAARPKLDPALFPVFWATLALVPLRAWVHLRHGALLGLSRPVAGMVATSVSYHVAFLALLGLAYAALPGPLGAAHAAGAAVGAWLAAFALADLQTRARLGREARGAAPESRAAEWTREALPMMLIVAMALVTLNADVLLLGALRGAEDVGAYKAAASLAYLVRLGIVAVQPALAPLAASAGSGAQGGAADRRLAAVARSASRMGFLPALACAAGLLVLGRWLLGLFNPEFVVAFPALAILALGFLVVAAMGPVETVLLMRHQQRLAAASALGACLLNVALNAALIPALGLEGAALATASSMVAWAVAMTLGVRRRLGLRMTVLDRAGA